MDNKLGIVTLLLGVISAAIAIVAFLLPDATKHRGWRIAIGVSFLFLTMILGGAGVVMLMLPAETTPINTEYAWVSDLVRLPAGVSIPWQPCDDEPVGTCARWNMYEHNSGEPLAMEILSCAQDGTYLDGSGAEQGGLEVGYYEHVSGITVRRCAPPAPQPAALSGEPLCGEDFYNASFTNGLADVTYTFPDGYGTGYISSNPAALQLPSGEVRNMPRQFVLIVEGVPFVQVNGVGGSIKDGAPVPNTFGCAYPGSDPAAADLLARGDFNDKVRAGNAAELYRLTAGGLELLDSHQP